MGRSVETDNSGWIVGNGAGTKWRCWVDGMPAWTTGRDKATRYARREDAEAVHHEDEDAWTVEPYLKPHDWFEFNGMTCCRSCGYVRNATSDTRPCKGPVRVGLRSPAPVTQKDKA